LGHNLPGSSSHSQNEYSRYIIFHRLKGGQLFKFENGVKKVLDLNDLGLEPFDLSGLDTQTEEDAMTDDYIVDL